jgi:hypothetical protein
MKKGRGQGQREDGRGRASKPGAGAQGRTARGGLPTLEGGVAILLTALALILMSRFLTHAGPLCATR